jgi:hypothetical protein
MSKKTYLCARYPSLSIGSAGHPEIEGMVTFTMVPSDR